jgi:hypothetical protein
MNTLVVGGTWGAADEVRSSKIALLMAGCLGADLRNGGTVEELDLVMLDVPKYDLVVWMPKISNELPKHYPVKKTGAVLIVSKVMHEGVSKLDAVKRIFMMHGNAVICIRDSEKFKQFELVDALGHQWSADSGVQATCDAIQKLAEWTRGSIRVPTKSIGDDGGTSACLSHQQDVERLLDMTRRLSSAVETKMQERYFGNVSTRCTSLFPSSGHTMRCLCDCGGLTLALVSARNTDKRFLSIDDMVLVEAHGESLDYYGVRKPSVDTAVQMALYRQYREIEYMIHGHAYITDARTTELYFPCSDMRELPEINRLWREGAVGAINLLHHGFLLAASSLDQMEQLVMMACANIQPLE